MPRVLIVDCHSLYRKGLRGALESLSTGNQVIEADSLERGGEQLDPDGSIDLLLADIDSPGVSLERLRGIQQNHPKMHAVAMAALATRADILHALEAGLYGFIAKSQPDHEILSAIQDILTGRIYVPASLAQTDVVALADARRQPRTGSTSLVKTDTRVEKLTRRQREILPLLAKGMSNKEIARVLKIAEGTTKIHASSLLRVLGVRNRTEAAVVAQTSYLSDQSLAAPEPTPPASLRRRPA